jgi:hypothetical protein
VKQDSISLKRSQKKQAVKSFNSFGNFKNKDYREWLGRADTKELSNALTRFAQLNQSKYFYF